VSLQLSTVGHGTLAADEFCELLAGAGISQVMDVRAYPGSRRHPHFGRDAMAVRLPESGVTYLWEPRLGGRRKPSPESRHPALVNDAFRAYADYMETDEFSAGLACLLEAAAGAPTAIMCAESLWWRCHRRLVSDALVLLRDCRVDHLMHDGRTAAHVPTEGVRVEGTGLVYDVGITPTLL
jgi:uncharacterized protein (DUF488 family)